jgi:hypothetical protein
MGRNEESRELRRIFPDLTKAYGFKVDSALKFPNFWAKKSIWLD